MQLDRTTQENIMNRTIDDAFFEISEWLSILTIFWGT
jgi:hypothetical protein